MGNYYSEHTPPFVPKNTLTESLSDHEFDHTGKHTDACLRRDIEMRLSGLHNIDVTGIKFTVTNGHAEMRGMVESDRVRVFIGKLVDRLMGIRGITNLLQTAEDRVGAVSYESRVPQK